MNIAVILGLVLFSTTAMASVTNSDRHDHNTVRIHNHSKFEITSIVGRSIARGTSHSFADTVTHSRDLKIIAGNTKLVSFDARKLACVFEVFVILKNDKQIDIGEINLCRTSDIIVP